MVSATLITLALPTAWMLPTRPGRARRPPRTASLISDLAIRHREAPQRMRGQIFTTGASLKITGFALGAAVAGPLAVRSLPVAALAALAFFTIPSTTANSPTRSLTFR